MTMTARGLAKLIEECGELTQVLGKKLAYYHTDEHPDGAGPLSQRMQDEAADVLAAVDFVVDRFHLGLGAPDSAHTSPARVLLDSEEPAAARVASAIRACGELLTQASALLHNSPPGRGAHHCELKHACEQAVNSITVLADQFCFEEPAFKERRERKLRLFKDWDAQPDNACHSFDAKPPFKPAGTTPGTRHGAPRPS